MAWGGDIMSCNICYSGGAKPFQGFASADLIFGECAEKAGHQVVHFSFKGHRHGQIHYKQLTEEQLMEADPWLRKANKILKRTYPTSSEHTNALLQRNYHQIKETKRIYAASTINDKGLVDGGTAWAVYMGILLNVPEIYVYDQVREDWFSWIDSGWWALNEIPKPERKYTGIGTRKLTEIGVRAIKELYEGPKI